MATGAYTPKEKWMKAAISAGRDAELHGEVPIGSVLVADEELIATGETMVARRGPVAHGENTLLEELGSRVWGLPHPLVLYSTLEPCMMCLGACINAGIDVVVYGTPASTDGGAWILRIPEVSRKIPGGTLTLIDGYLESETTALLRGYLDTSSNEGGTTYVRSLLSGD